MYKILLCIRYLRTRYIALASIISVMLGVATMIVVNSVMAGFSTEMRERLHSFLADIIVESRSMDGITDSKAQMKLIEDAAGDYIASMTPAVEVPGMATFDFGGESYTTYVTIIGADLETKASVGPVREHLDSYKPLMRNGVVIREPLRAADEPLSWNLTPDALERRRQIKEQEALFLQMHTSGFGPAGQTSDAAPPEFEPEADGSDGSPAEAPSFEAPKFEDADNFPEDTAVAGPGSAQGSDITNLLQQDPFNTTSTQADTGIRTGPLPARIFLGSGIVSFQAENPETGEREDVMMVSPGEDVILSTVKAGRQPDVCRFQATVVDTLRSGMAEYDSSIVLMNLDQLQQQRNMIVNGVDAITSIHIRLNDYADAPEVVNRIRAAYPPGAVEVRTWEEKQGMLLEAVEVETAILNVLLFLIIAVAGFGILAIFFMIVVEKTRDIGILKSLGASSSGVMSVFLSYGLGLGIVGSSAGVAIGLLFVRYINEIEDGLSWLTGRKVFDENIYYFSDIPTRVGAWMVFWVAAGAILIAVLASVLPARRAASLHPVRALRSE